MKSSGGRRKKNTGGRVAVIVIVLIIIAAILIWAFIPKDKTQTPNQDLNKDGILSSDSTTKKVLINNNNMPNAVKAVQTTKEKGAVSILLSGNEITADGSGVVINGNTAVINRAGTYHLSGKLDGGRIIVDAKGENVVLVLDGVEITSNDFSALLVHNAKTCTLIANGDTVNTFTDGAVYDATLDYYDSVNLEPNAAIFSKDDLVIRGTGTVKVNGKNAAGIICKDNLKIVNTNVDVTAVGNGINGKDSLTVQNSTVNVVAGKDGIRSTKNNDPSLGYAVFTDSNISVTADGDGIQTETGLSITNCSVNIVTGGGAYNEPLSSQKGIKCNQGYVNINSGYIYFDCADDAVNAYGDVTVKSGVINVSTGDDAVHSDAKVNISGGTVVVTKCSEGFEGMGVDISGGDIYINSKSDAINAAGGSDGNGFDGFGAQFEVNENNSVSISGGYIVVNTDGDGIDSNGNIVMKGGTLLINGPTSGGDGAIDYNGEFKMEGGVLFAAGSRAMAQAPSVSNQNSLSVTFDGTVTSGSMIMIECGNESFVYKIDKETENIVFSAPMLKNGSECVVSYGGKYSGGSNLDNVYSDGKFSGGSEIKLTLESGLTAYGQVGIGGSRGGGMFGGPGGPGSPDGKGMPAGGPPAGNAKPEGEKPQN